MELRAQRILRALQRAAAGSRQVLAGAVEIESEHRHRGAVGIALAPAACFRRAPQRARERGGIAQLEYTAFQIERIARPRDACRPPARLPACRFAFGAGFRHQRPADPLAGGLLEPDEDWRELGASVLVVT